MIIIVLCYDRMEDTLRCLESLRSTLPTGMSVLVVHNGSTDGSQAEVKFLYPEFSAIDLPTNLGRAGGNNVGIESALAHNFQKSACLTMTR